MSRSLACLRAESLLRHPSAGNFCRPTQWPRRSLPRAENCTSGTAASCNLRPSEKDAASVTLGSKPPLAALFINDCNWCKWTSRRLILSIEKSCFRGEMRLPFSLVFFPCSLINRETACKAVIVVRFRTKSAENGQYRPKAHVFPCKFPVNRENAVRQASSRLSALPNTSLISVPAGLLCYCRAFPAAWRTAV